MSGKLTVKWGLLKLICRRMRRRACNKRRPWDLFMHVLLIPNVITE